MKAAERLLKLREIFAGEEFAATEALCKRLRTSESSLRRDLIALEREGLVKRVHGGALAVVDREGQAYDFAGQTSRMAQAKGRIARATARLIEDGQTVILDGGSTVAAVARELRSRSLHVLTNSLPIAEIFKKANGIEVTLTGGLLYPRVGVLLGPLCEQMLGSVSADVAVMGTGGVTEAGFANNNTLVVGSERKMIEVARRVVIVADHTKFGRAGLLPLAPLGAAQVLVSDRDLDPRYREIVRSQGVELILA